MLQPGTKEWEAVYAMASPELKNKMRSEAGGKGGAQNNFDPNFFDNPNFFNNLFNGVGNPSPMQV